MNLQTVLLAGATGLVGSYCLKQLLEEPACKQVIALSRQPLAVAHEKLENKVVDFERLEETLRGVKADALFCCLGTTMKKARTREAFIHVDHDYPVQLARWASDHGVKQFLLVSAIGADAKSKVFYNRVKGETERDISGLSIPAITFFRPSLLLGARSERRRREEAAAWFFRFTGFLFRGRLAAYKPNQAAQVAAAMLASARQGRPGLYIVPAQEMHGEGSS